MPRHVKLLDGIPASKELMPPFALSSQADESGWVIDQECGRRCIIATLIKRDAQGSVGQQAASTGLLLMLVPALSGVDCRFSAPMP